MKDLTMSQALTQLHKAALKRGPEVSCSIEMELVWYPVHNTTDRANYNSKNKCGFLHLGECYMSPKFATWREVVQYFENFEESHV